MDQILKIAKRVSSKFVHDIYDRDDIQQEAYLAGLSAQESYDSDKGPFENYIARCINNSLINLVRRNQKRENITKCLSLDGIDSLDELSYEENVITTMDQLKELAKQLPAEMHKDYLKMISGVEITTVRKNRIKEWLKNQAD